MGCTSSYRTAEQIKKLKKLSKMDNWAKENKIYPEIRAFLENKKVKNIKPNYEEGFNILMEYFDCIPEDERAEVDKRLKKCNL